MFALLLPIVFSQLIEVQVVVNMSNGTLFIEAENKTPAEINNACSDNFFQPYPFTYDITDMCLNEKVECNNNFNNLTSICGGLITQLTAKQYLLNNFYKNVKTNLITQTNKAASAVILQGNLTTCLTNLSKQKGYWFWYIGGGIIIGAAGYGIAKKNKGTKVGY